MKKKWFWILLLTILAVAGYVFYISSSRTTIELGVAITRDVIYKNANGAIEIAKQTEDMIYYTSSSDVEWAKRHCKIEFGEFIPCELGDEDCQLSCRTNPPTL